MKDIPALGSLCHTGSHGSWRDIIFMVTSVYVNRYDIMIVRQQDTSGVGLTWPTVGEIVAINVKSEVHKNLEVLSEGP